MSRALAIVLLAALLCAASARPALTPHLAGADGQRSRTLSLFNPSTRESVTVAYWRDGAYVPDALKRLNHLLRDGTSGRVVAIDPRLFDILWLTRQRLGSTAAYHVLSGYRSRQSNAFLAIISSGVADDSLHIRGRAIDVVLPDRSAAQLRAAAIELGMGGVGYYPRTGFVHLDTGPFRRW
ncbi:MAG: DUF882 domain-containing protein [Alphaproteobacteria bacterium]|nr:DUF882 domain-containing protein [Alphaproteobacteria bacterium]MCW5743679.1 DUF882 domain-containing protein [Alphaproteobacteria bacterium]